MLHRFALSPGPRHTLTHEVAKQPRLEINVPGDYSWRIASMGDSRAACRAG